MTGESPGGLIPWDACSPVKDGSERLMGQGDPVDIDSELESLQSFVLLVIDSHYQSFVYVNQYRENIVQKIEKLCKEHGIPMDTILSACSSNTVSSDITKTQEQRHYKRLNFLYEISILHTMIQEFNDVLFTGELVSCADLTLQIEEKFDTVSSHPLSGGFPAEFRKAMMKFWIFKKVHFLALLDQVFESMFSFTKTSSGPKLKIISSLLRSTEGCCNSLISVKDLLVALMRLKRFEITLKGFFSKFNKLFIAPVLNTSDKDPDNQYNVTLSRYQGILMLVYNYYSKNPNPFRLKSHITSALDMISSMASFLSFQENPSDANEHNKATEIFNIMLTNSMTKSVLDFAVEQELNIPNENEELKTHLSDELLLFDSKLKAMKLGIKDNTIQKFVENRKFRTSLKTRTKLLSHARNILNSNEQNTVPVNLTVGSINSLYFMSQKETQPAEENALQLQSVPGAGLPALDLHVSVQAYNLARIITQRLEEANHLAHKGKIEAFYATKDLIDIFRCFLPISYEQNLAENPTRAMLFYNDCEYLAFILMELGHEVSKIVPKPLSTIATYLDAIPLIRRSGENALLLLMDSQKKKIENIFASCEAKNNLHTEELWCTRYENCVKESTYILQSLSNSWKLIMNSEMYLKTVGYINDVLIVTLTKRLIDLNDICEKLFSRIRYAYLQVFSLGQKLFCLSNRDPQNLQTEEILKYSALWNMAVYFSEHDTLTSAESVFRKARKTLEIAATIIS